MTQKPIEEHDKDTEMDEANTEMDKVDTETTENEPTDKKPEEADKENQPEQPVERPSVATTVSPEKLQQLVLMRTFHIDAVRFIEQIHAAIPIIAQLLSSKSKAEVLESMDFLVVGYNYKVKLSSVSQLAIHKKKKVLISIL